MTTDVDRRIWADLRRPVPDCGPGPQAGHLHPLGRLLGAGLGGADRGARGGAARRSGSRHNAYAEWYAQHDPDPRHARRPQHHRDGLRRTLRTTTSSTPGPRERSTRRRGPAVRRGRRQLRHPDHEAPRRRRAVGRTRHRRLATPSHRGPRRDLVGEIADAVRAAGCGSGCTTPAGWTGRVTDFRPHHEPCRRRRPAAGGSPPTTRTRLLHVRDLIDRYDPMCPVERHRLARRRASATGAWSLHELFTDYYAGRPDGMVNDRWGDTHWDFRTSEYSAGSEQRVRGSGRTAAGSASPSATTRSRTSRPAADRPPAGPAARRRRVPRRAPAAQRRTDRRRGDSGRSSRSRCDGLGRWTAGLGDWLRRAHRLARRPARR